MNIATTTLIDNLIAEADHFKKAQIVDSLRREACLSVKEIAERINKHPSYISHLTRLLKLPPIVIDGYYADQISLSHLVILSRLDTKEEMEQVYMEILGKNLTSAQTEELIRFKKYQISTNTERAPSEEIDALVTSIKDKIQNAKIKVVQTRIKAKIILELKGNSHDTTEFLRTVLRAVAEEKQEEKKNNGQELMTLE